MAYWLGPLPQEPWVSDHTGQIETQAHGLPDIEDTPLLLEEIQLTHFTKFEYWVNDIGRTLATWNLDLLIDITIPRPARDSPEFAAWDSTSRGVRSWIAWNMHVILVGMVDRIHGPSDYADEFMHRIQLTFHEVRRCMPIRRPPPVRRVMAALNKVTQCERDDWPTATAFIHELILLYRDSKRYHLLLHPFLPLTVMFNELQNEFPAIIRAKIRDVENMPHGGRFLSTTEFVMVCIDGLNLHPSPRPSQSKKTTMMMVMMMMLRRVGQSRRALRRWNQTCRIARSQSCHSMSR
ncbi:unnamed protein product [Penicillium olsonii]|nr:unnamed protein product [Penicillium olsonii]